MMMNIEWMSCMYGICIGVVPAVVGLILANVLDTYREERKKQ